MIQNGYRAVICFIVFVTLNSILGCKNSVLAASPPTIAEMENALELHYDDFVTIANYLLGLKQETVHIGSDGSTLIAGVERYSIKETEITETVERLRKIGCNGITMNKSNHSISFDLWWSDQDKGCGLAFSMDGEEPSVQFMTELIPLKKELWYYYVEDYNLWRINRNG